MNNVVKEGKIIIIKSTIKQLIPEELAEETLLETKYQTILLEMML